MCGMLLAPTAFEGEQLGSTGVWPLSSRPGLDLGVVDRAGTDSTVLCCEGAVTGADNMLWQQAAWQDWLLVLTRASSLPSIRR